MTIQQLAKSIEVVQDILIIICTAKDEDKKKIKMEQCIQKIKSNKESAAMIYKVQLESYSEQKSSLKRGNLRKEGNDSPCPMDIAGYEDFLKESKKYLTSCQKDNEIITKKIHFSRYK